MEYTTEVQYKEGIKLIIKRPILTDEEREKRIEEVRKTIRRVNENRRMRALYEF